MAVTGPTTETGVASAKTVLQLWQVGTWTCSRWMPPLIRSVNDIREIIDRRRIIAQRLARYKIYIIDEVHMLSNSAFNALLKHA